MGSVKGVGLHYSVGRLVPLRKNTGNSRNRGVEMLEKSQISQKRAQLRLVAERNAIGADGDDQLIG
jgi:hypothetical protein